MLWPSHFPLTQNLQVTQWLLRPFFFFFALYFVFSKFPVNQKNFSGLCCQFGSSLCYSSKLIPIGFSFLCVGCWALSALEEQKLGLCCFPLVFSSETKSRQRFVPWVIQYIHLSDLELWFPFELLTPLLAGLFELATVPGFTRRFLGWESGGGIC